jgi:DDE superfamily endonuclease
MDKIYPEFEVIAPFKHKNGQDLSADDKEFNHQVSKVRIVAKNVIYRLKRSKSIRCWCRAKKAFRVLGDFFRNSDSVHGVMAGVMNLRTINRLAVVA